MEPTTFTRDETSTESRIPWRKIAYAGIGLCVIGLFIPAAMYLNAPRGAELATRECQDTVKSRLNDPEVARFSETRAEMDDNDLYWEVVGTVRSTNAFGAVVPATFACTVFTNDNNALVINSSVQ